MLLFIIILQAKNFKAASIPKEPPRLVIIKDNDYNNGFILADGCIVESNMENFSECVLSLIYCYYAWGSDLPKAVSNSWIFANLRH